MRLLLPLLLAAAAIGTDANPNADPIRGGYPESAHKAFAARHALETRKPDDMSLPIEKRQSVILMEAELLAYNTCLNSWFSDPAHLPAVSMNDAEHHQLYMLTGEARSAQQQHQWPCWVMHDRRDEAQCQPLIQLGCEVGKFAGPDWLDDLCDGAHKGTHRTN